jgi:hypothetical protein
MFRPKDAISMRFFRYFYLKKRMDIASIYLDDAVIPAQAGIQEMHPSMMPFTRM